MCQNLNFNVSGTNLADTGVYSQCSDPAMIDRVLLTVYPAELK